MKRSDLISALCLAGVVLTSIDAWCQVSVLTQHNDIHRSGANLQEKQLNVASVQRKFGRLWTLFADGQIVAQPLYVSGLTVAGKGTFNALIVATMHNTIYVYDADKQPTQPQAQDALIWAQWLGDPQPENFGFDSWNTNFPEWGIVSRPGPSDRELPGRQRPRLVGREDRDRTECLDGGEPSDEYSHLGHASGGQREGERDDGR